MSNKMFTFENIESNIDFFKFLYITHAKYDKDWHSTSHSHHFTELFYIVSGKGTFVLPHTEIPVKQNDLLIINPNVEHTEKSNQKGSLEYIALGLEGISFQFENQTNYNGVFIYQNLEEKIFRFLNTLLSEVQKKEKNYETICHNIIEMIVIYLKRIKNIEVLKNTSKPMNQSVALAKYYMNQNYRDSITLDDLAAVSNVNKFYLSHIFKETLDVSPIEYLNNLRLKEAKALLETTNFTIADIARFNGFSSQSFFSQSFKRQTKVTPSEYRKQNRQMPLES